VLALADAALDDVLAHWSGLGYYSRARNLHRAAVKVRDVHAGVFPRTVDAVAALPGIGRSTAAAIVVFTTGARHAILDGNVKRVLARACGIEGYPGEKRVADALWRAAEGLLPQTDVEAYTQGLMDLGAILCRRRQPQCEMCPVSASCVARHEERIHALPAPRPRKLLPHRKTVMLVLEHAGSLLFEKRPASGIWGGLWSFPELDESDDVELACENRFGVRMRAAHRLPDVEHGFTHFRLTIRPRYVKVGSFEPRLMEPYCEWMTLETAMAAAIPAPVRRILGLLDDKLGGNAQDRPSTGP
jgi:A/G-specific adenine glycosylase